MDFVTVPQQDDRAGQASQQPAQEQDGLLRTQIALKGEYAQLDPSHLWAHQ
jgi:hypothetical protein